MQRFAFLTRDPAILKNLTGESFEFFNRVIAKFCISALSGLACTMCRYLSTAALNISMYERVF